MKLILEAGFISKDKKFGYLLNFEAYKQYIFTDSLNNICKSLMRTLADFISNIEDEYQIKFNIKPLKNFNLKKANLQTWCRVRLHLYHFWVRVLTLDGNDKGSCNLKIFLNFMKIIVCCRPTLHPYLKLLKCQEKP